MYVTIWLHLSYLMCVQWTAYSLYIISDLFDVRIIVHNATTTPDNREDAGTPGDMRKGGLEVRVGKESVEDDAVESTCHLRLLFVLLVISVCH